jgi:hypothetical protein
VKVYPFAIASAAVLGTAAVLVASGTAANETAISTTQQLLINQRISQAAVRRSNSALNYLAPVRTAQSDAANTGRNGVTPLSRVAGAGKGWPTTAIADQAITAAKLAPPVQAVVNNVHRIPVTRVAGGASATLLDLGTVKVTGICTVNTTLSTVASQDVAAVQLTSTTGTWSGYGPVVASPVTANVDPSRLVEDNVAANVATTLMAFGAETGKAQSHTLNGGVMRSDGASLNLQVTAGANLSLGANGGVGSCTFSGVVNT